MDTFWYGWVIGTASGIVGSTLALGQTTIGVVAGIVAVTAIVMRAAALARHKANIG